ncbi:MAG: GNAT family N-acetyltransferase, partial [Oscillospiraceae bacterium]|nr:GNAT family N-acetyltransferase [Oscillospiraceae bacterium]
MDTQIIIEPMSAGTVEAVAGLEKACFSEPWSMPGLMAELDNPHAVFLVARMDGAVAGYAGMHHIVDTGYITNIAVHAAYRRKGVAAAL